MNARQKKKKKKKVIAIIVKTCRWMAYMQAGSMFGQNNIVINKRRVAYKIGYRKYRLLATLTTVAEAWAMFEENK